MSGADKSVKLVTRKLWTHASGFAQTTLVKVKTLTKKIRSHPAQLCVSSQRISNLQTPPPPSRLPSAGVRLWGRGLPNPREELPADAMPAANTVIPGLWTLDYRPFLPVQCIVYSSHKIKKKQSMPSQLAIYHTVHHIYHAITPKLGGGGRCLQETPSHNRGKMGTAWEFLCGFHTFQPNEMMRRGGEYVTKKIKEHNVMTPTTTTTTPQSCCSGCASKFSSVNTVVFNMCLNRHRWSVTLSCVTRAG